MKRNHALCRNVWSSEGQIDCTKLSSSQRCQRCWFFLSLFPILGSVGFLTLIPGRVEKPVCCRSSHSVSAVDSTFSLPTGVVHLFLGLMVFRWFVDFSTITNIHHTIKAANLVGKSLLVNLPWSTRICCPSASVLTSLRKSTFGKYSSDFSQASQTKSMPILWLHASYDPLAEAKKIISVNGISTASLQFVNNRTN